MTKLYHLGLLVYVISRSVNILGLPMYLDEGNYVAWANLVHQSAGYAYVSLHDGKTPLAIWMLSWLRYLIPNYLLAARLLAVGGGVLTLVAWTKIANKYFGDKIAAVFWLVFTVLPYGVFMERLGLVDSITLGVCSVALWLMTQEKIAAALTAGVVWGLAYWAKSSAKIVMLLGWGVTLVNSKKLIKSLILVLLVGLVYREMVTALRTGGYRFWANIAKKEVELTFTPQQIWEQVKRGDGIYLRNANTIKYYFVVYVGLAGVLAVLGLNKRSWWLGAYIAIFTTGVLLAARIPASRYVYPIVPAVALLASIGLVKHPRLGATVVAVLAVQSLGYIVLPVKAWYAPDDRGYFIESELSALGMSQVQHYLQTVDGPNKVGVSGIWGVSDGALAILNDAGIEAVNVSGWNGDLGRLHDIDYAYLTGKDEDLEVMRTRYTVEVVREFIRPGSGGKVCLVKLYDKQN